MEPIDIGLDTINPPLSLVRKWARGIPGQGNPSRYMRECYLQYGIEQGARLMCERLRHWVANHQDELVDVDELFDSFLEDDQS